MLKNYIKIAWRNLLAKKFISSINILGLSVGFAGCLLMYNYVKHESSYDDFHEKGEDIVRVIMDYKINGEGASGPWTSMYVSPRFQEVFPDIKSGVRLLKTERLVRYGNTVFNEKNVCFADSNFFQVFSFPLRQGNASSVLSGSNAILLSQKAAVKLFGTTDPVGKTLQIGSGLLPFEIKGVFENFPSNSQMDFDYVASMSGFTTSTEATYWNANYTTYFLLEKGSNVKALEGKIKDFMKKEMAEAEGVEISYYLEPLKEVHLHSPHDAFVANGNYKYVLVISITALILLLIACFTYINLSTARAMERAKEVGIRKAAGAAFSQLFCQFMVDSLLVTALSLGISIVLAGVALPFFNDLSGLHLPHEKLFSLNTLLVASIFGIATAVLAGIYPALVISNFNPIKVLKGSLKLHGSSRNFGKFITVFQFTLSIGLLIATFLVSEQLAFMQNKKLGFDKEHTLVIPGDGKISEKVDLIKSELEALPNVVAVSDGYDAPHSIMGGYNMGKTPEEQMGVTANPVDENYLKACGIELLAGEDFSKNDVERSLLEESPEFAFILNESAAKALGWNTQAAIGKTIYLDASRPGKVKGVVKDFHFASLHTAVKPLVLIASKENGTLFVKMKGPQTEKTIAAIEKKMSELAAHRPFEYTFLSDNYQKLYQTEMRTKQVFSLFSGIALFLASLGLAGLAGYLVQLKTKEIGIRKVLGAPVLGILYEASKEFVILVGIAFLLCSPVVLWAINNWLNDFSYHINPGAGVFILGGTIALILTILIVSFYTYRVSLINPVKSLRSE